MSGTPTPSDNGLGAGVLGHVMQASAVGVLAVILFVDVVYLGPQREQRFMEAFQQQQQRADEREDRLTNEILLNRKAAEANGKTLDKIHSKISPAPEKP